MPGRIQVKIEVYTRRPDLSTVNIVPLNPQNPIRTSNWRNRTYLWPNKAADAVIVAKDDSYVVVTEEGRLIAVYGYAADSRKYGEYFAAVLRAKSGAKAEGERVGAENAELVAEVTGEQLKDVVAEMAAEGYHAASDPIKRAANVVAYLALRATQQQSEEQPAKKPEEASDEKEAQQSGQSQQTATPAEQKIEEKAKEPHRPAEERGEEEDELLREIEEARRRLAQLGAPSSTPAEQKIEEKAKEPHRPAEEREESEERKEQQEAEEERPSPFAKPDEYVVWINGQPFLRLWLVKASKPSEYLGSEQKTKVNGLGEVEVVKKLAPWSSKLETARRKLNDMLRHADAVWRGDGYFGYNTSIRVVLAPIGLREVAKAYAEARKWLINQLRKEGAPEWVIAYVEQEFKPRPVPMLVPLEAAVAILRSIEAWYRFKELPRVKQALRKHQEQRNRKMAKKLEQELEALKRQLKRLEEALAELEKRYAQSA